MDEVTELVEVLESVGSPFLQVRRPGLSPDELRVEVIRHWPPWWADYIDDEVCSWWGWHNGADLNALARGGEAWRACPVITPDRVALWSVHKMIQAPWDIAGPEHARSLGIVFPLGDLDGRTGELFLHKTSPGDDWTVVEHTFDSGLHGLEMADGQSSSPTFRDWLRALTEALTSGRIAPGENGEINVPGSQGRITERHLYPWRW